jgi:hypothetical protein
MEFEANLADTNRVRPDGRKAMLLYLPEDLIKRLKVAALDERRHAYELAEEAVLQWLASRSKTRKRRGSS